MVLAGIPGNSRWKLKTITHGDGYRPAAPCIQALSSYPGRCRVVSLPGAAGGQCFTAPMPRDNPATAVAACTGCAASWRGVQRAHCRGCHVTFDDEVLFDAHRRTGRCVPPDRLDLVAVGQVWCRLFTGPQRTAACPGGARQRR